MLVIQIYNLYSSRMCIVVVREVCHEYFKIKLYVVRFSTPWASLVESTVVYRLPVENSLCLPTVRLQKSPVTSSIHCQNKQC